MGAPGTAQWAGTPTDWSDQNRAYTMYIQWVNVTCYYNGNTTGNWPPNGYGPKKLTANSTSDGGPGTYATLGVNVPDTMAGPGSGGGQPITADMPDYNQSSLPKLIAPIAVICSVTVFGAIGFGVWKYNRGKQIYAKP